MLLVGHLRRVMTVMSLGFRDEWSCLECEYLWSMGEDWCEGIA
jgi:hypothetical protein